MWYPLSKTKDPISLAKSWHNKFTNKCETKDLLYFQKWVFVWFLYGNFFWTTEVKLPWKGLAMATETGVSYKHNPPYRKFITQSFKSKKGLLCFILMRVKKGANCIQVTDAVRLLFLLGRGLTNLHFLITTCFEKTNVLLMTVYVSLMLIAKSKPKLLRSFCC